MTRPLNLDEVRKVVISLAEDAKDLSTVFETAMSAPANLAQISEAYRLGLAPLGLEIQILLQSVDSWEKAESLCKRLEEFNKRLRDILLDPKRQMVFGLLEQLLQVMEIPPAAESREWIKSSLKQANEETLQEIEGKLNSIVPVAKKDAFVAQVFLVAQKVLQRRLTSLQKMVPSGEEFLMWLVDVFEGLDGANQLSHTVEGVREQASTRNVKTPQKQLAQAFVSCMENDVKNLDPKSLDLKGLGNEGKKLALSIKGEWADFKLAADLIADYYPGVRTKAQVLATNEIKRLGKGTHQDIAKIARAIADELRQIQGLEQVISKIESAEEQLKVFQTTKLAKLAELIKGLRLATQQVRRLGSAAELNAYLANLKLIDQKYTDWARNVALFADSWRNELEKWTKRVCPRFDGVACDHLSGSYSQLLSALDRPSDKIGDVAQNYTKGRQLIEELKGKILQEGKLPSEALQIYEVFASENRTLTLDDLEVKLGRASQKHMAALYQLEELELVQVAISLT